MDVKKSMTSSPWRKRKLSLRMETAYTRQGAGGGVASGAREVRSSGTQLASLHSSPMLPMPIVVPRWLIVKLVKGFLCASQEKLKDVHFSITSSAKRTRYRKHSDWSTAAVAATLIG